VTPKPLNPKQKNQGDATVEQVTDETFQERVLNNPRPVLVDFWAPWCAPCRAVAPVVEKVARQLEGEVDVVKLDVDQAPATAGKFRVSSIPTLAMFVGGKLVAQVQGAVPEAHVMALVDNAVPGRSVPRLKPADLEKELKGGSVTVVDVRAAAAFERHHVEGSLNAPLDVDRPETWVAPALLPLGHRMVLVDQAGRQVEALAKRVHAQKPGSVAILEGGLLEWEVSGRRLT
jgi:thioredoxin 1/putative thioredoxin